LSEKVPYRTFWIPPGFAHGFIVLSKSADFMYKATDFFAPKHERCILWNDPEIGIEWPLKELRSNLVSATAPLLSDKDKVGELLKDAEVYDL
jgi:dTDP-4-dehydrorhamnose 3,5-epimerase